MNTQTLLIPIFFFIVLRGVAQSEQPITSTILDVTSHVSHDPTERLDPKSTTIKTRKVHIEALHRMLDSLIGRTVVRATKNMTLNLQ